jgi:hypothetical protein
MCFINFEESISLFLKKKINPFIPYKNKKQKPKPAHLPNKKIHYKKIKKLINRLNQKNKKNN